MGCLCRLITCAAVFLFVTTTPAAADYQHPNTTITLTVPFGPNGIPARHERGAKLHSFKEAALQAFLNALDYISQSTHLGPSGRSPLVPKPHKWTFDAASRPQVASVTFHYDSHWDPDVFLLMTDPSIMISHAGSEGVRLSVQYGVIPGITVDAQGLSHTFPPAGLSPQPPPSRLAPVPLPNGVPALHLKATL